MNPQPHSTSGQAGVSSGGVATPAPTPGYPQKILAFKLGNQEYGVNILQVQEIRSYQKPTRMANAPSHILGVENLRGEIVPIVDMRLQLNLATAEYNTFTVVIVLNIGDQVVGMVVDSVQDVIDLTPDQLRPPPGLSESASGRHILAIATVEQRMLMLLDMDKLMPGADMGVMGHALH